MKRQWAVRICVRHEAPTTIEFPSPDLAGQFAALATQSTTSLDRVEIIPTVAY